MVFFGGVMFLVVLHWCPHIWGSTLSISIKYDTLSAGFHRQDLVSGCEATGSVGWSVLWSLGLIQSHVHQPQEWAGPPNTGCAYAVMPVLGVGAEVWRCWLWRGSVAWALGRSGSCLPSTSVKTSEILSSKSSGRRGTTAVTVGALGVPAEGCWIPPAPMEGTHIQKYEFAGLRNGLIQGKYFLSFFPFVYVLHSIASGYICQSSAISIRGQLVKSLFFCRGACAGTYYPHTLLTWLCLSLFWLRRGSRYMHCFAPGTSNLTCFHSFPLSSFLSSSFSSLLSSLLEREMLLFFTHTLQKMKRSLKTVRFGEHLGGPVS